MPALTVDDLDRFKMIARPQLSHDTEKILYLVTVPDADKYKTTLYVIERSSGKEIWKLD